MACLHQKRDIMLKESAMSTNNDNAAAAVIAFVSGAVIGVAAALLLAPAPGRKVREKLSDMGEGAADRMKRLAREAKFKVTPRTKTEGYQYDGGDAWI
jgi:gas vesicle protein